MQQPAERFPRAGRDDHAPFRRDEIVAGNKFLRLIVARTIAQVRSQPINWVATQRWPNDAVIDTITRAVSAPAMTSVVGWAAELAHKLVYDSLDALEPMSAGAQLLRGGLVLSFDGYGSISVPSFVAGAGSAGFVAEGQPIPVRQLNSSAVQLLPYKIGSICAVTQEMVDSSNVEAMVGDALLRSAGAALDMALFDANPATAARPAGLRNGIAALTPSSATDFHEAFLEDITTLFNSVAAVGGQGPYVLVTSAGRSQSLLARMARFQTDPELGVTGLILGTPAVGNDIIAVAESALVSAFSADPVIEAATASTLVMDDAAPGTPDTTQPTKSLFQTASVGIKMRWPMSWALRNPKGVAWLTPTWK